VIGIRAVGSLVVCCGVFAAAYLGLERLDGRQNPTFEPLPELLKLPHVSRRPEATDYTNLPTRSHTLESLPKFDPQNPFSVDLRSADASKLDLRGADKDLAHAAFDNLTIWPPKARLSPTYDPARVLELGKNPGLGVRGLHKQGITGRGISIGIVDQTLLTRHVEYADRLKWYEELNAFGPLPAQMHGPAVASIAVGKTVGVAPSADLYYIACEPGGMPRMLSTYASGIRRLCQINLRLPKAQKIRAISISVGYGPETAGYPAFIAAIREAEAQGIFVTWCGNQDRRAYGLAVAPMAGRDDIKSYGLPAWYRAEPSQDGLFVPMDHRTTASPTGVKDFAHYASGGASWTVPYLAGAYALAAQVDPNITPKRFWELARKTGRSAKFDSRGEPAVVGPILDMPALVKALRQEKK
jgi:hypothetical protein